MATVEPDAVARDAGLSDAQAAVVLASAVDRLARAMEAQNAKPAPVAPAISVPPPATSTPPVHPVAALVSRLTTPRGIRNNNPGNVRLSADAWQGEVRPGTDKSFLQFTSMVYGVRCSATVLHNYYARAGLKTIGGYIGRWAPPSENSTDTYAIAVAKACGVSTISTYPLDNASKLLDLCRAIFIHENGGDFVSTADIVAGVALVKL